MAKSARCGGVHVQKMAEEPSGTIHRTHSRGGDTGPSVGATRGTGKFSNSQLTESLALSGGVVSDGKDRVRGGELDSPPHGRGWLGRLMDGRILTFKLVEFLHHEQAPIRTVALEHLMGFSQGPQSVIFQHDNYTPVRDLKQLAMSVGKTTSQQALTILVNICADEKTSELIVEDDDFMHFVVNSILDLENRNADLLCILLSNVSKHSAAKRILGFEVAARHSQVFKSKKALDCLIDAFVKGGDNTLNKAANFDYLAFFFADMSTFAEGRKYFVTEQEYDNVVPITKLLVFTEKYDNKTRRQGVSSTIKNALFEVEAHMALLDESSVNLLPYLLLPIATSKDAELDEEELFNLPDELQLLPEDKLRDPVIEIVCVHLESLLLLCSTRVVRDYLRSKSVYPLIRELHKNLANDDNVDELCDRLVQMLMRDEDSRILEEIITKEQVGDVESEPEVEMIEAEVASSDDDDDEIVEVL